MTNYYVSSVRWNSFPLWTASTAYTVGQIVRRTGTSSLRAFRCEVAGTSGSTEPSWSITPNNTTTDNGITWRCITCVPSYGWDSTPARLGEAQSIPNGQTGDIIFVDSNHEEVISGPATTSISTMSAISVDASVPIPPTKADYLRGAKVRMTGTGTLSIGDGHYYGLDFVADTGSSTGTINTCNGNNGNYFSDCLFYLKNTGSSNISCSATLGGLTEWANGTKVRFGGNGGQGITLGNVDLYWHNSDANDTVSSDGSMPSGLFNPGSNYQQNLCHCRALNLTGYSGVRYVTNDSGKDFLFEDCLLNDTPDYTNSTTGSQTPSGANIRFINCSRVTNPVTQHMYALEIVTQKSWTPYCVLSDTPDLGGGKLAEQHRTTLVNNKGRGIKGFALKKWNSSTSTLTATVRGVFFGASLPGKSNFYLDLIYPNDASNTLAGSVYDPSRLLDTDATVSDASDWTVGAPLRANSTSYTQGDFIKVASNPGKIFIKENAGASTSAASEPGAFATASYGSTVSDGSVTWRCGTPFKLQAQFTPARAGFVRAQPVMIANVNAVTYIVLNPKLEIA